jgi:superfamily II DNA or RNA helicase
MNHKRQPSYSLDKSALPLRDYQREALDAVEEATRRGIRRQLIALPTGTGKTVILSYIVHRRRGRILILVHRDELVQQTLAKLTLIAPDLHTGVVKAERNDTDAAVIGASIQTLSRERRREQLPTDISTVIVDESHHASADIYRRVLEHVGSFQPDGPLTIGVTATPERADGKPLGDVFEEIVYTMTLLDAIQRGYLVDLRAVQVKLKLDWSAIRSRHGDFADGDLADAMETANAPQHAVSAWLEYAAGRSTVLFAPTVAMAQLMAAAFRAAGIAAEALDGTTPTEERRAILARLASGETTVVTNCGVLVEGFDCPRVSCIVIARPTMSRPLYVQMIGRGTRLHPGKDDCLILDLVGTTTRHDLQTTASLFGVDPAMLAARPLTEALAGDDDERDDDDVDDRDVAAPAATGQLIAVSVDLFKRRTLHWVSTPGGAFLLPLGDHHLELVPDRDDRWRVLDVPRRGSASILADGLPLEYAQGRAEDLARRSNAGGLLNPHATWRSAPPTEKQLATLRWKRIPIQPGLTKGQAADLITAAFARVSAAS